MGGNYMISGFIGPYMIGIIIFIISCLKNLLFIQLIYKVHSKTTLVEFDYRKKMLWCSVFAEITGFLAMVMTCIIVYDGFYPVSTALNSSLHNNVQICIVGIIVGVICNFLLTFIFAFRNDYYDMEPKQKFIISILESIINAPYTFLICVGNIHVLVKHLTMYFVI